MDTSLVLLLIPFTIYLSLLIVGHGLLLHFSERTRVPILAYVVPLISIVGASVMSYMILTIIPDSGFTPLITLFVVLALILPTAVLILMSVQYTKKKNQLNEASKMRIKDL